MNHKSGNLIQRTIYIINTCFVKTFDYSNTNYTSHYILTDLVLMSITTIRMHRIEWQNSETKYINILWRQTAVSLTQQRWIHVKITMHIHQILLLQIWKFKKKGLEILLIEVSKHNDIIYGNWIIHNIPRCTR